MAATGMEQVIEGLLLSPRPWGLLIDVAQDLNLEGDRWRGGVKFPTLGCSGLRRTTTEFCAAENLDPSVSEVQTVTEGGSGLTSFTLTYAGQTTGSIAANATAATVQTALRALSTVGGNGVVVTGSAGGPYTVTFTGGLAGTNVAPMTSTPTGGSGTVTVATSTQGVDNGPDRQVAIFQAFSILAAESCSANDINEAWLYERLDERWNAMLSEQVAAELMSGSVTGTSPSLQDSATTLTTGAVDAKGALARIEKGLAERLHGAQGIVHLSPEAMHWGDVTGAIVRDPQTDKLYTKTGHLVSADAGYVGAPPTGTSASGTTHWVYGSGPVGYQIGPPRRIGQVIPDIQRNIITGRVIAECVLAFDPCPVVAAEFTIPT